MINDFIACFIVDLYNLTIKYNESINQIRNINLFFFFLNARNSYDKFR